MHKEYFNAVYFNRTTGAIFALSIAPFYSIDRESLARYIRRNLHVPNALTTIDIEVFHLRKMSQLSVLRQE